MTHLVQSHHVWAKRSAAFVLWRYSQERHVISYRIYLCPEHHQQCHSGLRGKLIALTGICLN